jgi:asparagine synthase (glutamine-hydrolysing)
VPFLDHKLVEFAATLPNASKIRGKGGKTVLRTAMRGVLPDAIIDRPKRGFPIPIGSWLRTSLRQFTRDHLLASDSACSRYVDRDETARIVREHEQGDMDRSHEIWTLLVFEFWHRHFIDSRPPPSSTHTRQPVLDAWQLN